MPKDVSLCVREYTILLIRWLEVELSHGGAAVSSTIEMINIKASILPGGPWDWDPREQNA